MGEVGRMVSKGVREGLDCVLTGMAGVACTWHGMRDHSCAFGAWLLIASGATAHCALQLSRPFGLS